jgi:hypothetical protein
MSGHRMSISGSRASLQKVIGLQQAEEQAVLAAVIAGAGGAAGMPGQGVADELLSTVANTSSRSISSSSADRSAEDDTSDQLVAVAIQSKQAAEALLLLLELVRCTAVLPTASSTTAGAGTTGATPAPPAVELVAVRQLRSVPGHVRERITDVRSITAGAAASSTAQSSGRASASASAGAGAVKAQLAAGAPTLLAVLHGPDVASVISAACESWASLFSHSHMPAGSHLHRTTQPNPSGFNQRGVGPQAAEESSEGSVQLSLAAAMGPESVAQYAGVGAYRAPLVLGVSATQSDARHVLAACFHQGSQVRLDPSFHSGALRPALSNAPPAGAEGHADMSALCSAQAIHRLLSGPHPFSTVVSVVVGHQQQLGGGGSRAPHLSVLPRLIKVRLSGSFCSMAIAAILHQFLASPSLPRPPLLFCLTDISGKAIKRTSVLNHLMHADGALLPGGHCILRFYSLPCHAASFASPCSCSGVRALWCELHTCWSPAHQTQPC